MMIQEGGQAFPPCSHKGEATFITTSPSLKYGWWCHTPDCAAAQNSRAAAIFPTVDTDANKNGIYLQHVAQNCSRQRGDWDGWSMIDISAAQKQR